MELSSLNELLDRFAALGVAMDYDQIGPKPDLREINSPQVTHHVAALFLHHCNMMGDLGRVDLSQIGFRPNLIVVCSDSQGGDAIQELVQGRELHWI